MIVPILLHTRLTTVSPGGEEEVLERTYRARLAQRADGTWAVRYADADNGGETALHGTAAGLTIVRNGETRSRLRFQLGEHLEGTYLTAGGKFELSTFTTRYEFVHEAHRGRLVLHYDLLLSGTLAAQNCLEVVWERS